MPFMQWTALPWHICGTGSENSCGGALTLCCCASPLEVYVGTGRLPSGRAGRLLRQFLIETLVLALAGGAAGALLAFLGIRFWWLRCRFTPRSVSASAGWHQVATYIPPAAPGLGKTRKLVGSLHVDV